MKSVVRILLSVTVVPLLLLTACGGNDSVAVSDRQRAQAEARAEGAGIDRLRQIADSLEQAEDRYGLMITMKHLGKACRNNSRFDDAINAHKRGLTLATELADTVEIIRALNNLGTNFRRMGILDEAAGYHYQALTYCEKAADQTSPEARKNRVISLNGIGNILMTLENDQAADSVLRAALEGEKQLGSELGQAINLANIGAIMERRGQNDSARVYYQRSLEMNQRAGSQLGISLCYTHFGQLDEKADQLNAAVEQYQKAYRIMRQSSDTWHWLEACQALARVHIKLNQIPQAQRYISQADSIATAIHSLEHQASNLQLKYQLARKQGDISQALNYHIAANELQDSLLSSASVNQVQNSRVQFERQRRQAEVNLIQSNYETQRRLNNVIIAVAVLVVLLAAVAIAFLLYSLRVRKRDQELLRRVEKMRTGFFTNVTHEFRTPLTVILGLADQLRNSADTDVQHEAAIISRQGNNLLQLINQLLDISKVSSAIGNPEWRHGDIVPYLAMLIESYRQLAATNGIELAFAARRQSIEMDFAPYYLRRVVSNLVGNALKYTPPQGHIYITCDNTTDSFALTVADNGVGIDPNDLPHIFETFYQGQAATVRGETGSGVGLALVHQIVTAMGGTITVHSDKGKGAVFTVTLPLKQGEGTWPALDDITPVDTVQHTATSEEIPEDTTDAESGLPLLLVVEDHGDVAKFIGSLLQNSYQIAYAHNGTQALQRAEETVPDLIITDLMMPGDIDGLELCRRIRDNNVLCHIPLIVITALSGDDNRIRGVEAGADAYLVKPFNADELRARVTALLEQRKRLQRYYAIVDNATQPDSTTQPEPRQEEQPLPMSENDKQFYDRFTALVHAAVQAHQVDIEAIASDMAMTSTQLRRKLRALTGQTTVVHINRMRMRMAAQLLLEQPDLPIADIADQCGYDDMAYFSRIFKQIYNTTPTQYRAANTTPQPGK